MSNQNTENFTPDYDDYSPNTMLDEAQHDFSRWGKYSDKEKTPSESIADRSRRIVMETMGETLSQYQDFPDVSSQPSGQAPASAGNIAGREQAVEKALARSNSSISRQAEKTASSSAPENVRSRVTVGDDGIITLRYEEYDRSAGVPVVPGEPPQPIDFAPEKARRRATNTRTESDASTAFPPADDSAVSARVMEKTSEKSTGRKENSPEPGRCKSDTSENLYSQAASVETAAAYPNYENNTLEEVSNPTSAGWDGQTDDTADEMAEHKSFSDVLGKIMAPLVRLIAGILTKRQMQQAEAARWPDPEEVPETPELSPQRATKFFGSQVRPLRLRCRISAVLCVILAWISFRLPLAGALGQDISLQAGVSLIFTLAVVMAALDVVHTGLRQLFSLHLGLEAVAVLAVFFSCIDAVMVLAGFGEQLPFCVIGATSLTAALWGERLTCTALRHTFKTAASSQDPSVLTAEKTDVGADSSLLRSGRSIDGIVRRSEQQNFCEAAYAAAAPILIAAALLLSVLASLRGQGRYFLHILSALLSVSASFAAFFSFALPYAVTARRLRRVGAAIAGYAGCADIGKAQQIVITDEDLFPPGTMKFSEINILEGAFVNRVVSCTASLVINSGSGTAGIFHELMTRRGYNLLPVEDFKCYEGGGLSGIISGESVLVGSAGFMNLMGIRLPQNLNPKNAICTAIRGELVGVFTVEYIPVTSVQDALVSLMHGRTQAVFALQDFNITPLMIRQLFRLSTDKFNFPSFQDRYLYTTASAAAEAPVSAVLIRNGMLPMVDAAEAGRKLYSVCRIGTFLSLAGSILGILIMFLLCRAGSFETATVGNVLAFMLLWALPVVILSLGQGR